MQSGTSDSRTGKLKILAGPDALLDLIERATRECNVSIADGTLRWTGDKGSLGGTLQGDRIESVTQHDATFVVYVKSSGNGIRALTFRAASKADATEWVRAVESIIGKASAVQPQLRRPRTGATPSADATPVKLKYKTGNRSIEKDYAMLAIACDPRALTGICDYTPDELETFKQFSNYTFHTTLLKAKVPANAQKHAVVFAPSLLEKMDGSVYAYRNESAKQFGQPAANAMKENLVAVYQLAASSLTEEQFKKIFMDQLRSSTWWPFGMDFDILANVITPYFDRFGNSALEKKQPWTVLQRQGEKRTLLVHASSCFESALHCWSYANLLDSVLADLGKAAPIVVLGAGVSGILFAAKLRWMGYTNIDILENTNRYGGKTHTIIENGPYPPGSTTKTVCELGTCYLSPAYDPMVDFLRQQGVLDGNQQIDFGDGDGSFRGIVTAGQFSPRFKVPPIMDYSEYIILKAEDELGLDDSDLNRKLAEAAIALALSAYSLLHIWHMGWYGPMPSTPPSDYLLKQTFEEFLTDNGLRCMIGILQYGYEVQGYGSLKDIPAYYGLVWITPPIIWAILRGWPVVTAWSKGWGNVWEQTVKKLNLNITYLARTTSITRRP